MRPAGDHGALFIVTVQVRAGAEPRIRHRKPYYGVNVQVIADAAGRLVWVSAALPGAVHDLTAARTRAIIEASTSAKVMTFADKAYQGARGSIRTSFTRHRYRPKLSAW